MTDYPEHIVQMAEGYIEAALWSDCIPACTCGEDERGTCSHAGDCPAEESGGMQHLRVADEDVEYVRGLCAAFYDAASVYASTFAAFRSYVLSDGTNWHHVGHDLRLTSSGHGTGFWDREPWDWADTESKRAFKSAQSALTDIAQSPRFSRDSGGDCYQVDPDCAQFDHLDYDPPDPPRYDFEMFSDEGGKLVGDLVRGMMDPRFGYSRYTVTDVDRMLMALTFLYPAHREATDTAVREAVCARLVRDGRLATPRPSIGAPDPHVTAALARIEES